MNLPSGKYIDATAEYQTLRDELLQSRRYVFERPLLIAALGVAATNEPALVTLYPPVIAALLLFNFWFTVNRLLSSARIVSYIQVVLEEGAPGSWRGWETSLRAYRIWKRTDLEGKEQMLDVAVAQSSVRDSLMYYPAILALHIFLVVGVVIGNLAVAVVQPAPLTTVSAVVTGVLALVFGAYSLKWKPSRMQTMIERNRIIWKHVLERSGDLRPSEVNASCRQAPASEGADAETRTCAGR
jgi:hypothetical protein